MVTTITTPVLTGTQRRALRELVRAYEASGDGEPVGTLAGDILEELEPRGYVRRTTWGGTFHPYLFPTKDGIKMVTSPTVGAEDSPSPQPLRPSK